MIRKNLGSPIFFTQDRIDKDGNQLLDEERLTSFGKLLRNTSVDESSELVNIFLGNMNLVGPRPLLVEYKELYSKEQWSRHKVKPGITRWDQINGRNNISWNEKINKKVRYKSRWRGYSSWF